MDYETVVVFGTIYLFFVLLAVILSYIPLREIGTELEEPVTPMETALLAGGVKDGPKNAALGLLFDVVSRGWAELTYSTSGHVPRAVNLAPYGSSNLEREFLLKLNVDDLPHSRLGTFFDEAVEEAKLSLRERGLMNPWWHPIRLLTIFISVGIGWSTLFFAFSVYVKACTTINEAFGDGSDEDMKMILGIGMFIYVPALVVLYVKNSEIMDKFRAKHRPDLSIRGAKILKMLQAREDNETSRVLVRGPSYLKSRGDEFDFILSSWLWKKVR